jgi:hypothetical protein
MRCHLTALLLAVSCASIPIVTAGAQTEQTESKTRVKAEHGKIVKYTGCVRSGSETRTFVLQNVVPVAQTETTGTSGTMTTTTYMLLPGKTVELQEQVGHKVEVSGVLVPPGKGETRYETKTKTETGQETTKGEVAQGPLPQLKVLSVRSLADSCS